MFWQIFTYELKYKFSRLGTYIYWLILFLFMFLIISALGGNIENMSVSIGGLGGKVNINSPYIITILNVSFGYMAMILLPATIGTSIYRDFKNNTHSILYSYPVSKAGYLGGRFLGAFIPTMFIFSGLILGCMAAMQMPWIDQDSLGAFRLSAYTRPFFTSMVPNILITGLIIFSLASLTRELLATYMGCILIIVLYGIGGSLLEGVENQTIASLIDPLGSSAMQNAVEYWTVNEKNEQLVPLTWHFIANRLIWITLTGLLFGIAFRRFKFTQQVFSFRIRKKSRLLLNRIQPVSKYVSIQIPRVKRNFSFKSRLKQLISLSNNEFRNIIRNPYFIAIILTGIILLIVNASNIGKMYGTTTFPVTYKVMETLGSTFYLFLLIIITFYAGELVWRERDNKTDGIINSMPLPNWIFYSSKLSALMMVGIVIMLIIMIFGLLVQIFNGFFDFQMGVYLAELAMLYIDFILLGILAVTIHTLVNNKYVGHFILVIYFLMEMFMGQFGLEHNLYKYNSNPSIMYSAMNGYGHFVGPYLVFKAYWASLAVVLAILSNLLWIRGNETNWKNRIFQMKQRFTKPAKIGLITALIAFVGLGGFIYYNTNILNEFNTTKDSREMRAEYEKQYSGYAEMIQPRITDVNVNLDIYPEKRDFKFSGYYILKNKSNSPIDSVIISQNNETIINKLNFDRETDMVLNDEDKGFYIYQFNSPILPGDSAKLDFNIEYITRGFQNNGSNTDILKNGTFIHSDYLPVIGYLSSMELEREKIRKEYGLPPKKPIASINDTSARMDTYIANNSDWVNFQTTVSTKTGQTAIAPGYLTKKWEKNGRTYYHYQTESRILNFFAWLSADYTIKKDKWKNVDIAVYYQEEHDYNIDNMINAVKKSLDYYSENFSPYQYRQVRILEFPRFSTYAQAFPNTIPFSEAIGFIADVDEDDINYPFWVTAHEMAHQWWAHQVIGGNVEGCTVMSEVLAQYSSAMVMAKEFDQKLIKDYMDHEQHRYLKGRTTEQLKENDLLHVRPSQGYIHYGKGCVAMYALQDYIGEKRINKALRDFTKKYAFQEPPFVTSLDFYKYIKEATPDSLMYLTRDYFERIILYENKINKFDYEKTNNGKYKVTLEVGTRKYEADSLGNEKELNMNDWVDVAIYSDKYKAEGDYVRDTLYFKKHRFTQPESTMEFIVDKKPAKAGIDPFYKLIDRHREDNYKSKGIANIL